MKALNSIVAVFDSYDKAEASIRTIQRDGFDMKHVSLVGMNNLTEEHVVGFYNTGDRMQFWGSHGAFWGSFWGLLFGSAFLWVPKVGPLLIAGPLVGWIVNVLEKSAVAGGSNALSVAFTNMGIPKSSIAQYEIEIKEGKLLLVAHGTIDEMERAKNQLLRSKTNSIIHAQSAIVGA